MSLVFLAVATDAQFQHVCYKGTRAPSAQSLCRTAGPRFTDDSFWSSQRSSRDFTTISIAATVYATIARKWLEPHERTALVEACQQVDPEGAGRIPVAAIGNIMATVGAEVAFESPASVN